MGWVSTSQDSCVISLGPALWTMTSDYQVLTIPPMESWKPRCTRAWISASWQYHSGLLLWWRLYLRESITEKIQLVWHKDTAWSNAARDKVELTQKHLMIMPAGWNAPLPTLINRQHFAKPVRSDSEWQIHSVEHYPQADQCTSWRASFVNSFNNPCLDKHIPNTWKDEAAWSQVSAPVKSSKWFSTVSTRFQAMWVIKFVVRWQQSAANLKPVGSIT